MDRNHQARSERYRSMSGIIDPKHPEYLRVIAHQDPGVTEFNFERYRGSTAERVCLNDSLFIPHSEEGLAAIDQLLATGQAEYDGQVVYAFSARKLPKDRNSSPAQHGGAEHGQARLHLGVKDGKVPIPEVTFYSETEAVTLRQYGDARVGDQITAFMRESLGNL